MLLMGRIGVYTENITYLGGDWEPCWPDYHEAEVLCVCHEPVKGVDLPIWIKRKELGPIIFPVGGHAPCLR